MKLALDSRVFSSRLIAIALLLATAVCSVAGWPIASLGGRLVVAAVGLLFSFLVVRQRLWIVRHPLQIVLGQLQTTLEATCIAHEVADNRVRVTATGTTASVREIGPCSLVTFHVLDTKSNKERFLLEVMTKYLRFIGKDESHGRCPS